MGTLKDSSIALDHSVQVQETLSVITVLIFTTLRVQSKTQVIIIIN